LALSSIVWQRATRTTGRILRIRSRSAAFLDSGGPRCSRSASRWTSLRLSPRRPRRLKYARKGESRCRLRRHAARRARRRFEKKRSPRRLSLRDLPCSPRRCEGSLQRVRGRATRWKGAPSETVDEARGAEPFGPTCGSGRAVAGCASRHEPLFDRLGTTSLMAGDPMGAIWTGRRSDEHATGDGHDATSRPHGRGAVSSRT